MCKSYGGNMKILITGGAGFIASHIQDAYLALGHEVAVADSLATGKRENLNPQSKFYQLDICNPEIERVFEDFKPEVVSHHAAQVDVRKSVQDPSYDAQVNIVGFINLLKSAQKIGCKKIIFASTGGAIYGEQDYFPADEAHPLRPASPYGLSKMVGEEYLRLYQRLYDISYVALRYANVYGPRQNAHGEAGVVAIFSEKMIKNEVPTINGNGDQTRDYVYVSDVIQANVFALNDNVGGTFNIGTSVETTVNQLFSQLRENSGKPEVKHGPAKAGEQKRSVISHQKALRELNWSPKVGLVEGVNRTYQWFKERS